jgi:hypothetical protein
MDRRGIGKSTFIFKIAATVLGHLILTRHERQNGGGEAARLLILEMARWLECEG